MISSKRIAEITGRVHRDITRAIRNDHEKYEESFYISSQNKKIKIYLVSEEYANNRFFNNYNAYRVMCIAEDAALKTIEQLLNIKLFRQYKVLGFRIDGYDKANNIAYEIDESQHKCKLSIKKDAEREAAIRKELGCTFVRVRI